MSTLCQIQATKSAEGVDKLALNLELLEEHFAVKKKKKKRLKGKKSKHGEQTIAKQATKKKIKPVKIVESSERYCCCTRVLQG